MSYIWFLLNVSMQQQAIWNFVLYPDLIAGLYIPQIGINPGLTAAFVGHHYAGPGNHFCKYINIR